MPKYREHAEHILGTYLQCADHIQCIRTATLPIGVSKRRRKRKEEKKRKPAAKNISLLDVYLSRFTKMGHHREERTHLRTHFFSLLRIKGLTFCFVNPLFPSSLFCAPVFEHVLKNLADLF